MDHSLPSQHRSPISPIATIPLNGSDTDKAFISLARLRWLACRYVMFALTATRQERPPIQTPEAEFSEIRVLDVKKSTSTRCELAPLDTDRVLLLASPNLTVPRPAPTPGPAVTKPPTRHLGYSRLDTVHSGLTR